MSRAKIDYNQLYANTPPVRLFFRAAVPGAIGMFAMSVYTVIEGIIVGQYLGGNSFAAINLSLPLVLIGFAVADMIGVGSSVPIAIALGRGDEKTANNLFTCAVLMIVLSSLVFGAVVFVLGPQLLQAMGAEPALLAEAVLYLRVNMVLGPVCSIVFAMDNFLRISGYVRRSMWLNLLMSALQIGAVVLFIVVLRLGVLGSALAFNLGAMVCAILALIPFVRKKAALKFQRPQFSLRLVKEVLTCGSPTFLANIAGRLFALLMNFLLIRQGGTVAVAAYSVMMYSNDLVQPLMYGMCDSLQPAIGYNWGSGAVQRVKKLAQCVFAAAGTVCLLALALTSLGADWLAGLFVDPSEGELMTLAAHGLRLFSIRFVFWWLAYASQSFYNALEMPKHAMVLTLSSGLVVPLIMVGLLWPLGLDGLLLNQSLTWLPVAVLAALMLRRTARQLREQAK